MLVLYTSLTGNVKRFTQQLKYPTLEWQPSLTVDSPFVFVVYTIGFGRVPKGILEWLTENKHHLKGVVCSGNRNWGENFGAAGRIISEQLGVPLLHTFELAGTLDDIQTVEDSIDELHRVE